MDMSSYRQLALELAFRPPDHLAKGAITCPVKHQNPARRVLVRCPFPRTAAHNGPIRKAGDHRRGRKA